MGTGNGYSKQNTHLCNFSGRNNFFQLSALPSTLCWTCLSPTALPAFQQELEQKFRFFSHSWTTLLLHFLPDFNYPSIMCKALEETLQDEKRLKHFGRKKSMTRTTTTGKRKAKSLNEFFQLFFPFVLHLIYSSSPHHHHLHHSVRLLWFICVWIWSWVKRKSSSCWRNEWITTRGSRDSLVKLSNFFYKFCFPPCPLLISLHRPLFQPQTFHFLLFD